MPGAALAVVAGIFLFGVTQLSGYIWFAFAGAALAAVLVYGVASMGREGATPVKLALAGAALSAGLSSLMYAVLVTNQDTLEGFRFWQVGSVSGRGWDADRPGCPVHCRGPGADAVHRADPEQLSLGDDVARGLGQRWRCPGRSPRSAW